MTIASICLVLTALLAYLNHRYIGLPGPVGIMSIALALSGGIVVLDRLGLSGLRSYEESLLHSIDFSELVLQGMLSVLLFAGALRVKLRSLKPYWWQITGLVLVGTTASALIIGISIWYVLPLLAMPLSLGYCLAFGALISPTDPVAVLGTLKSARAPQSIETLIAGESLFNDGIGVVLFMLALTYLGSGTMPTVSNSVTMLLREAGGGVLLGVLAGYVVFRMLSSIDSYEEEVLITLAAVAGCYTLAEKLGFSGPVAMAVVGLLIGNFGRTLVMSDDSRKQLDMFWNMLDIIFNAVLFLLIGMEVVLIHLSVAVLLPACAAIVLTLAARLLTAALPLTAVSERLGLPPRSWQLLTWGGLRGGVSVALALSLPAGHERDIVLTLTYAVVAFSMLVQALTIGTLTRRINAAAKH